MIKSILFDMDGVLVDSHDSWVYIFNKTLKKFENKKVSIKEFDAKVWSKAFEQTAKKYFKAPVKEIRAYYAGIYNEYRKRLKIMPGAVETLSGLKSKGVKLALVSNTQRKVVKRLLKDIKMLKYFDFVLGGDDVKKGKPAPDLLNKAMKLLKLKKKDAFFVGDTRWDRMAAGKAKLRFVGYKIDGDGRVEDLKGLLSLIV